MKRESLFFDYQRKWLADQSLIKFWRKSRRIGATFTQAYEDVRDCIRKSVPAVWFSSADASAAEEYIIYCERWAKAWQVALDKRGIQLVNDEDDFQTYRILFANGTKITAMTSNPKKFRSKGGKVVLDEFGHHDDALALWTAAEPSATWGFPIRVLSTENGKQSLFYTMCESLHSAGGKLGNRSLHTTDIYQAIEDGLLSRIMRRQASEQEIQQWLQDKRASCFDEIVWLQEYCCIAVDAATAFITLDSINKCKSDSCLVRFSDLEQFNNLYAGYDVARSQNLAVLWVVEWDGHHATTRYIETFEDCGFEYQYNRLCEVVRFLQRLNIDKTGMGLGLYERLLNRFGDYTINGVHFTNEIKNRMAFKTRAYFHDERLTVPSDDIVIRDIHSVQRSTTSTGAIKLSGNSGNSHADRFWACSLGLDVLPEIIDSVPATKSVITTKKLTTVSLTNHNRGMKL